jgi:hypothetical protein
MANNWEDWIGLNPDGQMVLFEPAAYGPKVVWATRADSRDRRDRHWAELREQRWLDQGGCCALCGDPLRRYQGDLHHLHYEHYRRELIDDVILVHRKCHAKESRRQERLWAQVLFRARYQCELVDVPDVRCTGTLLILHKHHATLGRETVFDLIAVCQAHAAVWLMERQEAEQDIAIQESLADLAEEWAEGMEDRTENVQTEIDDAQRRHPTNGPATA